jgi:stearoyl-CoA desaturase (delta-9 desaturase)
MVRTSLPLASLRRWFDTGAESGAQIDGDRIDWLRTLPFIAVHLAWLAILWVGISRLALEIAAALYALRMFAITGFYHRYFAHRTFRTSRAVQFLFACIGASSVQRGPLWWAAHIAPITSPPTLWGIRTRPRCMASSGATWDVF